MKPASTTDLLGKKFGRLLVKDFVDLINSRSRWLCICDCGNEKIISRTNLINAHVMSCGCLRAETARKNNSLPNGMAHLNNLFRTYQNSAKNRGISFELTKEEFILLVSKNCFYCNESPSERWHEPNGNGYFPSSGIDRINSSRGYIIGNVVPCCKKCNYAKKQLSTEEFKSWIIAVYINFVMPEGMN
jgi:hypothetical protein